MFVRWLMQLPGIRLGLLLAGLIFVGLLFLGQRQPMTFVLRTTTATQMHLDTQEYEKHFVRYVGLQGWDIVWGRDPKPFNMDDLRLPYGLAIVPFAFLLIVIGVGAVLSRTTRIVLP